MKFHCSKIFIIAIIWTFVVLVQICFPESIGSPHNNGYNIVICGILSFFLYPSAIIAIITCLILGILLFVSNDIIHPIGDTFTIMMCLSSLMIALKSKFSKKERWLLYIILSIFIIGDILGIFFPSMYKTDDSEKYRYIGILHGANVTATIFALVQIAVYELKKDSSKVKTYLYLNLGLLILMFFAARTRSLVFFFPYWILQVYTHISKRIFYICCIVVLLLVIKSLAEILSTFRFGELESDGSYITRLFLYETMFEGIKKNIFVIPHGSNSANLLAKTVTSDDNFAAHNDLLLYWHDWGVIFFFVVAYGYKKIKNMARFDLADAFIILAWSSACLHNVLLFPQVFLIFIIIINIILHCKYDLPKKKHIDSLSTKI